MYLALGEPIVYRPRATRMLPAVPELHLGDVELPLALREIPLASIITLAAGAVVSLLALRAQRRGAAVAVGAGAVGAAAWLWSTPAAAMPALAPAPSTALVPAAVAPAGLLPLTAAPISAPAVVSPVVAVAPAAAAPAPSATLAPAAATATSPPPLPQLPPQMPVQTFHLTDQMLAKLSQRAVEQVLKFFNTPIQNPMGMSPDVVQSWNAYRAGEWADYTSWTSNQTPATTAGDYSAVGGADALSTASGAEAATTGVETVSNTTGATVGTLSVALQVVGVVGCLVDIGFTLASDQPMALKAINIAIDVAIIVCLFIPVFGWIIALVLGVVKLLLGMFGSTLFGDGGAMHKIREAREVERTLIQVGGMAGELGNAMTPRELVRVLWAWSTGYCGGVHTLAVMTGMRDPVTGQGFTIARNPCYTNTAGPYREWPDVSRMTLDDQAIAILRYAESDFYVSIQAGVNPEYLAGPNWSLDDGITKKCAAWSQIMDEHGISLDNFDTLATEQRKTPRLQQIARFFGRSEWTELVGWHLQDLWTRYIVTSREGTLLDFAQQLGYADWITLRDYVMDSYGAAMHRLLDTRDRAIEWMLRGPGTPAGFGMGAPYPGDRLGVDDPYADLAVADPTTDPRDVYALRIRQLTTFVQGMEALCNAYKQRAAEAAAWQAFMASYPSM